MNLFTCYVDDLKRSEFFHSTIEYLTSTIEHFIVGIYAAHCEKGLFTWKFHLLDHLGEDLRIFGIAKYLDVSAFEKFKFSIKQSFRPSSMRKVTRMHETVSNMGQV